MVEAPFQLEAPGVDAKLAFERALTLAIEDRLDDATSFLMAIATNHLRRQWIAICHKHNCPVFEPAYTLRKLRSSRAIDSWTYRILSSAVTPPKVATRLIRVRIRSSSTLRPTRTRGT